jgi:hypothetical protein
MKRQTLLGVVLGGFLILGMLVVPSYAERVVLRGLPNYCPPPLELTPQSLDGPPDLTIATLDRNAPRPIIDTNPLSGVATYVWWYGCSPTSGGMMVGYWDGRPGFGGLYNGDASLWGGDGNSGTRSMVASTAHITAGSENHKTYGDWHNSTSYPNHEATPNCVADFMKTEGGGTWQDNIAIGLKNYVQWDGTWGGTTYVVKQAYAATAADIDVPFWGGTFSYNAFKAEIDDNRPVLLDVLTIVGTEEKGHSVVGYGYQDNMFQVKVPLPDNTSVDLTVGGFAVKDTWPPGTAQSSWCGWTDNIVLPTIDGNGVEWWPFIDCLGASWNDCWDWMVSDAVTLSMSSIPEPSTLSLLALGGWVLLRRHHRRRRPTG